MIVRQVQQHRHLVINTSFSDEVRKELNEGLGGGGGVHTQQPNRFGFGCCVISVITAKAIP
jgi:hypothetical protein